MNIRTVSTLIILFICQTGAFDVAAFLEQFKPGAAHEELPHGVPVNYSWQSHGISGTPSRPSDETTHMNLWGQVYVNTTNYHAPNVRVEVIGSQLWTLHGDQWVRGYRTNDLAGGAWKEDFTSSGGSFDMKQEDDGGQSFVPADGYNAHFWPDQAFLPVPEVPRALLSFAFTRLVLDNPAGADNRTGSAYIIGMGADWRKPDGSCPNDICTGFGVGRFIKPDDGWRCAVMSTMSSSELSSLPMPPDSVFLMPDGRFPDGTTRVPAPGVTGRMKSGGPCGSDAFHLDGKRIGNRGKTGGTHQTAGIAVVRKARAGAAIVFDGVYR